MTKHACRSFTQLHVSSNHYNTNRDRWVQAERKWYAPLQLPKTHAINSWHRDPWVKADGYHSQRSDSQAPVWTEIHKSLIIMIIIIMHVYHVLINALSDHMIHINLNTIFYTHVDDSPTKTVYIRYYMDIHTCMHACTHPHTLRPTTNNPKA